MSSDSTDENSVAGRVAERAEITDDFIEGAMQRNDALRVIGLALASCAEPIDPAELLRNIEEGGYTLRLTTHEERLSRNLETGLSQ